MVFSFCKIAKQNDKRAQIVTFNAFNTATVKLLYLQPEYRVICGQLFPAKKKLETCGRNKKRRQKKLDTRLIISESKVGRCVSM
jgi:hypothetical protein